MMRGLCEIGCRIVLKQRPSLNRGRVLRRRWGANTAANCLSSVCSGSPKRCADSDTPALQVHLYIGRDAGGVLYLEGEVQGVLHLICQRCLGRMEFPVQRSFRLALVHSEAEADRLSDGYEPLLLEAERLIVRDVIEDELLLVLPDFPQHGAGEACTLPEYRKQENTVAVEEKPNPFAALASLKRN